ncbi:MAG: hypothetical protein EBU66_11115 [Bacteroidetes bacterium]|nr:hypothetical protein [bacterium]NBP65189.1 hypothetical protein [Bacteroidota bacterium]
MPLDALLVGLVVLLICGAAIFYLYMRISFYERKGSMMETVIVDLRMAIDSLMHSVHSVPTPISPSAPHMEVSPAVPLESTESENIPEDKFYSSVLDLAHEEATVEEEVTLDKLVESVPVKNEGADSDLETLNKTELLALAEKKGLRAKKSSSRTDLLTLLRRSSPIANSEMTAGVENGSGSGSAAALDGSVVDLGQDVTSLQ